MYRFTLIASFIILLFAATAQAGTTPFAWSGPSTADPYYAELELGTSAANVLVQGTTATAALRVPSGATLASIQIRSGTDVPYTNTYSGTITGATMQVGIYDNIEEANAFNSNSATYSTVPPLNDYFGVTGAVSTLTWINTSISTYGRYQYPVAENQYIVIAITGGASFATVNSTGAKITVRFQVSRR